MLYIRSFIFLVAFFSNFACASTEKEIECLAKNIYYEARNQSSMGKLAVALVTFNRVKSIYFPNTICEVVWQKYQFSWTHDGKSDTPKERIKYSKILQFSSDFYQNLHHYFDITNGSLYYHAYYVEPCWVKDGTIQAIIGDHKFYYVNPNGTSCWKASK